MSPDATDATRPLLPATALPLALSCAHLCCPARLPLLAAPQRRRWWSWTRW